MSQLLSNTSVKVFFGTKLPPNCLCLSFLVCFVHIVFRSIYVSEKLPTYPSPKSTLTLTSHLGQNVGLGKG